MDPNINFGASLNQGLLTGTALVDGHQARKRRGVLAGREDLLFEQGQEDAEFARERRGVIADREDLTFGQEQDDRERTLEQEIKDREIEAEDRELRLADEQRQREEFEAMAPYQRQLARAQAAGAVTTNALTNARLKNEQREATLAKQKSVVLEAQVFAQRGDPRAATRKLKELEAHGYAVDEMLDPTANFSRETMQQIVSGDLPLSDPKAQKFAAGLLQPSFLASGRNSDRYEVVGLVKNEGTDTFTPRLREKETGRTMPATDAMSSEDSDVATEITMQDLMTAAQGRIQLEEVAMQTQIAAAAAGLGIKGEEPKSALEIAKIEAETRSENARADKAQAEAAQIMKKIGEPGSTGYSDEQKEAFVGTYAGKDPDVAAAAQWLAEEDGFDAETAVAELSTIEKILADNESASPIQAIQIHRTRTQRDKAIRAEVVKTRQEYPDLDPAELLRIERDYALKNTDAGGRQAAIDGLVRAKKAVKDRNQERAREKDEATARGGVLRESDSRDGLR